MEFYFLLRIRVAVYVCDFRDSRSNEAGMLLGICEISDFRRGVHGLPSSGMLHSLGLYFVCICFSNFRDSLSVFCTDRPLKIV